MNSRALKSVSPEYERCKFYNKFVLFCFYVKSHSQKTNSPVVPGTRFQGVIRTIINADRRLCFVVPKDDYDRLKKSEKFQPDPERDALNRLPKIGKLSFFYHKRRNKMYRVYTLDAHRLSTDYYRALFLYDTGEVILGRFSKEQFFHIPDDIEAPGAFALFAKIKVPFDADSENYRPVRIENMQKRFVSFKVLKNSPNLKEEVALHLQARCIVLSLDEIPRDFDSSCCSSDDDNDVDEQVNVNFNDKSDEIEQIYSPLRTRFTLDDLPKFEMRNVAAGSIILVYPLKFADDSTMYVNIAQTGKSFASFTRSIINEGFALKIWLNKLSVVAKLQCIEDQVVRPLILVNQLLIASTAGEHFERVVVKNVHNDGKKVEV